MMHTFTDVALVAFRYVAVVRDPFKRASNIFRLSATTTAISSKPCVT